MRKFIAVVFCIASIYSCTQYPDNIVENKIISDFVDVPSDLSNIDDSVFIHLDHWLVDAEIIGISEGDHGMNEGMDFRNSYIKYLVRTNQIQVIAFESGLIESRLVDDYINGKDLSIDTALTYGFTYTFGQFKQNKELLKWLRKTNASRDQHRRVHFYGFDMSGSAPNPYIDNATFALKNCLEYLKKVDIHFYNKMFPKFEFYFPYFDYNEYQDGRKSLFYKLIEKDRAILNQMIDQLQAKIQKNKKIYIQKNGLENFEWALVSVTCAKQNTLFLEGCISKDYDHSSREQFMVDNLKWIKKKEGDKKMLLFAHLAHLAKDVSRLDEHGKETIPNRMFGERLANEFNNRYKVIGNFFNYLDYYDAVDSVKANSFSDKLHQKHSSPNFCLKINQSDSLFLKRQIYGISFKGNTWMTPSKGVDVIFYTEKQHFFDKDE